jgi:methionyl aminopeptidase
MGIVLRSSSELAKMRDVGAIVAAVLDAVEAACVPGVTTAELEAIARRELRRTGATSAFLGYGPGGIAPYPAVLCTSINEVIIHGIPSKDEVLREGDVIGIDFACLKGGFAADAARTVAVGVVSAPANELLATTRDALAAAIAAAVPGGRIGDIGAIIQERAFNHGFGSVREFVGHGIGRTMHEPPQVPNYGRRGTGLRLKTGMVIAIEPMFMTGKSNIRVLDDEWTVVTADRSLAAHFEHTVAITDRGPRVLTASA